VDKEEAENSYLFFRRSCLASQKRFTELADPVRMPRVFLHGNPHIDNFAKLLDGEAMIDFDRSRSGPYAWDIVRFLSSLSLRRKDHDDDDGFLPKKIVKAFLYGYEEAFTQPEAKLKVPEILDDEEPSSAERSTRAYADANLRWAKRMRESPLFTTHPTVQGMLRLYFRCRNEPDYADRYNVKEAGLAAGTLGKPRIIALLELKDEPKADYILLDVKEVYQDPDTEYFFNPFVHHGLRMIEAAYVHAPGLEHRLGFFTWREHQYWVRQIPPFKGKIKGDLSDKRMEPFAYAVGVQLGRGHRRSLREVHPDALLRHLNENIRMLVRVAAQLNEEIMSDWREMRSHAPSSVSEL
jgi:hypothetical protein